MKLKISDDRKVVLSNKIFGVNNENKVVTIELEYPKKYTNYTKTIEMKDGDWLVCDTIENDEYILKSNVTSHEFVSAQIVFTDENDNIVFKSEIFEMRFEKALNAKEPLDDTDAKAEEILIGKKAYVQSEKITGTMPNNGELTYTPTTQTQTIPEGYTTGGIIGAVTSDIDENIIPTNIRAGVTVLGVEGNLEPDKPDQNKTVTPTTQEQVIRADTGYELAQVTVNPVTSAIDNNIQAGNIKKGVSILEVEGTYEPTLQNKSIEITENGTTTVTADEGYNGLNEVEITTNVGGLTLTNCDYLFYLGNRISQIQDILKICKPTTAKYMLYQASTSIINLTNLDSSQLEDISYMFANNSSLSNPPLFDTSNVKNMSYLFQYCSFLSNIPVYDTSKVTNMQNMFQYCSYIRNDSLNNILQMCAGATSYTSTKTLKHLGLNSTQATTCTTLSNWADAQTAGWTTGY